MRERKRTDQRDAERAMAPVLAAVLDQAEREAFPERHNSLPFLLDGVPGVTVIMLPDEQEFGRWPDEKGVSMPHAAGTRVRYRTMGTGTVREHACPPERPCDGFVEPVHRYWMDFTAGRYKGTERLVWVRDDEALLATEED
jgi:hypothetical protein